jgi:hypothetical protein
MRIASLRSIAALFLFSLLTLPTASRAAWPLDGNGIGTAANNQQVPKAVSDGAGGAIITWEDNRTSTYYNSAQRVDALGVPQWTAGGVKVSLFGSDRDPSIIPDGAGGAIIAWWNGDIYAQRINASGVAQWTAGGVVVSAASGAQQLAVMCSDNAGGGIIAWQDNRGPDYDIYARRITSAGVPQWIADGSGVSIVAGNQTAPQIAADGLGGVLIGWMDTRSGNLDIYAQRLSSLGGTYWLGNGYAVCTAANNQSDLAICADGSGGAIMAWEDNRAGTGDLYAGRVTSVGNTAWAANGIVISAQTNFQFDPVLLPDGLGGAFIAWADSRSGLFEIYTQRVNNAGTAAWTVNGVALGTLGNGTEPSMVTDGLGGFVVAWQDSRTGVSDIYARRVNSSGVPQWSANGALLCSATGIQDNVALASDNQGGAIVVFEDERVTAASTDVYAQRIERNGFWGYPSPNIAKVRDVPGDQGGQVNVSWDASRLDPWPDELIDTYTVWRSLSPASAAAALAAGAEAWRDHSGPIAAGTRGAIRTQEIQQTTYYWQLIHTVSAYELTSYSDLVPTPFDSTASSNGAIAFQVIAHAATGQWVSEPATGRSVDNVAPGAPLQLMAQRIGADVHLIWNQNHDLDLDKYKVYRKTSSGVTAIPANFLSDAIDTVIVDAAAPPSVLYYIVTAIDTHDNQSAKSNEASVSPVTGVDDTPRSYTLSVSNYPNPFNPRTTVKYTVPSRGHVSVKIYDATGACVATLVDKDHAAGAYTVDWNGVAYGSPLASGVYFARIDQNGTVQTRKLTLLK